MPQATMEKSIKGRFKRLIPSRSRQASRERHDAADSQTSHEATATASTDVAPHSSSPAHLEKYFPGGNTLGLSVLHSPEDAQVDIIFIHGLMGDAYRTWADDRANVYWPVDLLGKENNDARIIAFGYDSQVLGIFSPVGQNTLRGHADSILGQIANLRPASSKESRRKIILVVHSLGGLVAKKALCVSAQSPHKHLRQLHEEVHGILFLGTPHRGSNLAPNAQRLAKLFKYFGGAAVNPGILEPLLRNSPILEEVENDFGNWLKGKKEFEHITCFYEELEVPSVGFIVSKESATISGTPGPYSIHGNHMQMAKFGSSDDPGFKLVHGELKRWIDGMKAQQEPGEDIKEVKKRMLQSLAFSEMDSRSQLVKDTTPGTCSWAFESSAYKQFLGNGGLLWIKGKPGSGKSTLLRKVTTRLRKDSNGANDIIASFFFWGSGSELQRSKLGLHRSLLHQLCQSMPQLCSEMTAEFKDKESTRGNAGQAWDWSERQLSDTLKDHLGSRPLPRRTWIFLDALDEAGEENAKTIVGFLKDLSSAAMRINTPGRPSLGICFTCRHYPIIRAVTNLRMCLEDHNGQDISTHSRKMLVEWGLKSEEVEQLCDFIRKRADGVFLWAQLVLDQIEKHHLKKTFLQIKRIIATTPPELKQMYNEKLRSIDEEDKAQSLVIFQWICFAREPLSLDHLRIALLLDSNRPEKTFQQCLKADDYIAEDYLLLNVVVDRTRGLAQIAPGSTKTIQLIHQSVRDFLEKDAGEWGLASGPSHHFLFRSCLKFLSFPECFHHLDEKSSLWLDQSWHVFTNYATSHWHHHALAAERGPRFEESILHFLDMLFDYKIGRSWYDRYRSQRLGYRSIRDNLFDPDIHPFERRINSFDHDINPFKRRIDPFDGANTLYSPTVSRITLLHAVAGCGLLDVLKLAIWKQGLPIGPQDAKSPTLLHWAASCGQKEVAEWLLSSTSVDPNEQDSRGATPLHWLIQSIRSRCKPSQTLFATLQMFSENSAVDWQLKDERGSTLLHKAASWNLFDVVQTIMRKGTIDINVYDNEDWTPLDTAICARSRETLETMITTICDRLQSMERGYFAENDVKIDRVHLGHHLLPVSLLWKNEDWKSLQPPLSDSESFQSSLSDWDEGVIEKCRNREDTILHFAAQGGHINLCQILIDSGLKVGVKDHILREPLHRAAESGHQSIVKLLLDSGAISHSRDRYGLSPAHLAIIYGHFDIAQTLSRELERSDHGYMTPFFRAILDGNKTVAYEACIDDADCHRNPDAFASPTVLQMAVDTGNYKMVQASVTPSSLRVTDGYTPLCLAVVKGHLEIVRLLLDKGVDPIKEECLHLAVTQGQKEIVTLLISRGTDAVIDQRSAEKGQTPLHFAAEHGNKDMVRKLIKHGADPNARDYWEDTPVHLAVENGHENIVRELKDHGADTRAKNKWGRTPEDSLQTRDTEVDWGFLLSEFYRKELPYTSYSDSI